MTNSISPIFSGINIPNFIDEGSALMPSSKNNISDSHNKIADNFNPNDVKSGIMNFGKNGSAHLNLGNILMELQLLMSKMQVETSNKARIMAESSFFSQLSEEKKQATQAKTSAITRLSAGIAIGVTTLGTQVKAAADYSKANNTMFNQKAAKLGEINHQKNLASSTTFAADGSGAANKGFTSALTRDLKLEVSVLDKKLNDLNAMFESQKAKIQAGQMSLNSTNELVASQTKYDAEMHGLQAKRAEKNKQDSNTMVELVLASMKQIEANMTNINNMIAQMINHYSGFKSS